MKKPMFNLIIPELTDEESKTLRPYLEAKTAPVGSLLIEQGQDSKDLLFMFQGKYDVYQGISIAGVLIAVRIATDEPPTLFGEGSLFSDFERSATVLTVEEGKYFKLPYNRFCDLREEHPAIALKLLDHAGSVISERYNSIRSTIYDNILKEAKTSDHAMELLTSYIGASHVCNSELAEKLFGNEKEGPPPEDTLTTPGDEDYEPSESNFKTGSD